MTREEAWQGLEGYALFIADGTDLKEALSMAIEALQTPPISQRSMYQLGYIQGQEDAFKQDTNKLNNPDNSLLTADSEICKEQKSKLDLISRAEAIEAIELVNWYHQNKNKDMVHGANDDEHQAWYKADDVYKALEAIPSVNKQRNGDLISRAEAIEALGEEPLVWCDEEYEIAERDQWRADVEAIKSVPSADRSKGHWIERERCYDVAECSVCGRIIIFDADDDSFCPNCGADMRGESNIKAKVGLNDDN